MSTVPTMVNGEPNPGGPGRYCMPPPGTCYCRTCPHWKAQPAPDWEQIPGSKAFERIHGKRRKR